MALRTYYHDLELPALRRIIGPVSVLAGRGKRAYYAPTQHPMEHYGLGSDTLLLSDWRLAADEPPPSTAGALLYDLSDARLLEEPEVQRALAVCHAVLTPNLATANLARRFCVNAVVAPTHVHWEWLRQAPAETPPAPMALLVTRGRPSWMPLIEETSDAESTAPARPGALVTWLKANPEVRLVCDDPEVADALEAKVPGKDRIFYMQLSATTWPLLLRTAFLLIAPGKDATADAVILFEAAMVGVACAAGEGYAAGELGVTCRSTGQWEDVLDHLTKDDRRRRLVVEHALPIARRATAVQGADGWLRRVEKAARFAPPVSAPALSSGLNISQ